MSKKILIFFEEVIREERNWAFTLNDKSFFFFILD